jgi:hypothetical protein
VSRRTNSGLQLLGVLLALFWIFGIPVVFIVVELFAMRALRDEPALVFWLGFVVMWNWMVLCRRAWQLARTGRVNAA